MRVARAASAERVGRSDATVVRDPVLLRVVIARLARVAGTEHHRDQAGVEQVACMRDEIRRDIVLVVAARVVHGQEVLVAHGHLPHDLRLERPGM